uniref:Uncharacterized protein n=2 Tax=unclassified Caudoviricetes TaxID=2788787 RepID=A0A8S5M9Y8_9CAUD|nr:MAG TPA: hypothetical protein [Siphoviridae sp. ctsDY37]DAF96069.1 MAG TPA: hypothetical protein [Siphoviridae sp. cteLB10]
MNRKKILFFNTFKISFCKIGSRFKVISILFYFLENIKILRLFYLLF